MFWQHRREDDPANANLSGRKALIFEPSYGSHNLKIARVFQIGMDKRWNIPKFILHLSSHAGAQRPIVLLIDSVSSHIDMDVFQLAIDKQIELSRIIPNATYLMQPLDKDVFGPLKKIWHQVAREYHRQTPSIKIDKSNFTHKLKETYLFYKPLTIVNKFQGKWNLPSQQSYNQRWRPASRFHICQSGLWIRHRNNTRAWSKSNANYH